jgi:hypothetical protein
MNGIELSVKVILNRFNVHVSVLANLAADPRVEKENLAVASSSVTLRTYFHFYI